MTLGRQPAAVRAQDAKNAPAAATPCIECIRIRVGLPRVVRGPAIDIADNHFSEIRLPDGRFRGFDAHGETRAVDGTHPWVRAAHDAAPNVPIVSWAASDPVGMGWAQTLARPGGMITGVFQAGSNVKRFELLKEVRPQATTFGYLISAANPGNVHFRKEAKYAARRLGMSLEIIEVKDLSELPGAFDRMVSLGVVGLAIIPDPVLSTNAPAIAELARAHKFLSVGDGGFANAGGLFAFADNYPAMAKRSAWYVDQILRGIAPGDLPAELATEFRLIVNLKTAKELGIAIPPSVLARADKIIE